MKKPKRKPKWLPNPSLIFNKVNDNQPHSKKEVERLSTMAWMTLFKVQTGKGNVDDLNELVVLTNVTRVLSEQVGAECVEVCEEAREAFKKIGGRFADTKKIVLTAGELNVVRSLLDLYEEFLPHITPKNHRDAWEETWRRLDAAKKLKEK